ncbi:uridylate-specific endoribonuclease B-like isoform X1 [Osmia bicornis bicornis]|uniref:uridylate-specific endoribonuclease B-like isoform X1 n=2 Tax=Osmia bicornis bicornis TaxID=1437191 RepID=UPI001EAEBF00|nr:uridylate-specific endoribonuclease B-like isoform X1 [Osmia bicornis bicornis]
MYGIVMLLLSMSIQLLCNLMGLNSIRYNLQHIYTICLKLKHFYITKMLSKIIGVSFYILVILNTVFLYISTSFQIGEASILPNMSLISNIELINVSEQVFNKSSYELFRHLIIRYQGQTNLKNFTDVAPERLLYVSPRIPWTETTKSFMKLLDNYELDTYQPEIITKDEDIEENEFINNLMKADVILHVMNFLSVKGFFENNSLIYKNILKEIWFHLYSRSKGINGSSGFEHVFVGERKPRKGITGLHNWISFSSGELLNTINYFGFSHNMELSDKMGILETYFTYGNKRKMSTIFIGTTPELEVALYTLCFFARPNKRCNVSFTKFKFSIQTYVLHSNNKKFVASAFPIIGKR